MLRLIGLALVVLLAAIVGARAECINPRKPPVMSAGEFMKTPFGTLAFRFSSNRFLPFESMGCFDVSSFGLSNRKLYINSTSTEQEFTYLAGVVSRPFPGEQIGIPALSLELRRNESATDRPDVWIDALSNEAGKVRGILIGGTDFHVLRGEYDSQPIDVEELGGYATLPIAGDELFEDWHALLSEVPGEVDPNEGYRVLANSRETVAALTENIEALKVEGVMTLRTKAYLVKFMATSNPSFQREVIEPGPASCLYVDYRVGGQSEPPISHSEGSEILVLRMDKDAVC